MTTSDKMEPMIYDLGLHQLTTQEDQRITIEDETTAINLESEETYRLFLVLRELFQ